MTPNWLGRESPYLPMKAPYSHKVIFRDDGRLMSKEYSGTSREVVEWEVVCQDRDKVISTGSYAFTDAMKSARKGKSLFNRCFYLSQASSRSRVIIKETANLEDEDQQKIVPMPPHPSSVLDHEKEASERVAREAAEPEAVRQAMGSAKDERYFRPETSVPDVALGTLAKAVVAPKPSRREADEARLAREVAIMREQETKSDGNDCCAILAPCTWREGREKCTAPFFCPKKVTPGIMEGGSE